ncbi:MAG: AraC family transcriptional regulator ligand-binding domain-containing protein [Roseitalea porphyridii]|uniref:AraC family transcriptional regulator n=1 Tax=Roseitalea porphyridii TaxID=1852022 RepID=UPI0032EC1A1C
MTRPFVLDIGWAAVLDELRIRPDDLLRAARLPADLLRQERPTVDTAGMLRLWTALAGLTGKSAPGLEIARALPVESFSPPLLAVFCSPNLKVAMERLALFKPLFGPFRLSVSSEDGMLSVCHTPDPGIDLPPDFVGLELAFLVSLARKATRVDIRPRLVSFVDPPERRPYEAYFGVRIRKGSSNRVVFSAEDAARPFLSANPALFSVFEPELRRRLEELPSGASVTERVRAALVETLPSGRAAIGDIAPRLGLSPRSLQRRLGEDGTSFQAELRDLRKRLAEDFLSNTAHSSSEIAYLLGYEDPNSFIRAFHGWTGTTPEAVRRAPAQPGGPPPP